MDELERKIQAKIRELSARKELNNRRIFLFGHIIYTECINNFLDDEGYRLSGIIDNDKNKQGKIVIDMPVMAPEDIEWEQGDVILIMSIHEKSMKEQINRLSPDVKVIVLADRIQYEKDKEEQKKFWLDKNYKIEIQNLCQGAAIYENLKDDKALVVVLSALGDMFACGLYFREYEKKIKSKQTKIVVASKGVYKVAQLFGIKNIVMISNLEMELLVKYMLSYRSKEDIVYSIIYVLDIMAGYKKISFPRYWAKYFLRIGSNYQVDFPSIWDEKCREKELIEKGMREGKSVILAPYANSCERLPFQFWELLTEELIKRKYVVFTNTTGSQQPVKNSIRLEIPLNQLGNYLEFAGYFISLRSGLCDVAGRSQCKQIIIFRDRSNIHSSQVEQFDLHCENISNNAIQYVYDDCDIYRNIDWIINVLVHTQN